MSWELKFQITPRQVCPNSGGDSRLYAQVIRGDRKSLVRESIPGFKLILRGSTKHILGRVTVFKMNMCGQYIPQGSICVMGVTKMP
jgi:hypothetical protein